MAINVDNVNISKADIKKYSTMLEQGKQDAVEELFLAKYIIPLNKRYSEAVKGYMTKASSTALEPSEVSALTLKISGETNSLKAAYKKLFKQFSSLYTSKVFNAIGVTSPAVKNTIKGATTRLFLQKIEGALSQTNTQILSSIRTIQQDLMLINQRIDAALKAGTLLKKNVDDFKRQLIKDMMRKNKKFYDIIEKDRFITYSNGSIHSLDDYADMAIRTTLLNVDRTAVEVKERSQGRRVVEFYERDHRKVITEREICKTVQKRKLYKKSLVALDVEAASILKIPYIENIRAEGSFGPNCRHSIRAISKELYNKIDQILYFGKEGAA